MTNPATDHRKVYARGYFDAMREMGKNTGAEVQQVKAEAIYNGMNGMLKKVYDAIPISQEWTAHQICDEVKRSGGSADQRALRGCLNTLVGMKIVREPSPGEFVRVDVRQKQKPQLVAVQTTQEAQKIMAQPKQVQENSMDSLTALSSRVLQIVEVLRVLAKDIDSAALDIAESAEKSDLETAKLRQLQVLLKSLG
jgi:hypothetical protein